MKTDPLERYRDLARFADQALRDTYAAAREAFRIDDYVEYYHHGDLVRHRITAFSEMGIRCQDPATGHECIISGPGVIRVLPGGAVDDDDI